MKKKRDECPTITGSGQVSHTILAELLQLDTLYWPSEHVEQFWQVVAPVCVAYVPAEHVPQALTTPVAKVPAGQITQALKPAAA